MATDVEERLARLEAMQAASTALARYADACDAQDLERVVGCFSDEGEVQAGGGRHRGRAALRSFFQRAWAANPTRKHHFITNVELPGFSPGRISIRAGLLYAASDLTFGWGRYDGQLRVDGERMHFEQLTIVLEGRVRLGGGNP